MSGMCGGEGRDVSHFPLLFLQLLKSKKPFAAARRFLILGFIYLTRVFYSYFRFYTTFLKVKIFFVFFFHILFLQYIYLFSVMLHLYLLSSPLLHSCLILLFSLRFTYRRVCILKKKLVRLRENYPYSHVQLCLCVSDAWIKKTNFPIRNPRIARS